MSLVITKIKIPMLTSCLLFKKRLFHTVDNFTLSTVNALYYLYLRFIYLFYYLAVAGLCCCTGAFSSCAEQGLLFVVLCGLLIVMALLVAEHRL